MFPVPTGKGPQAGSDDYDRPRTQWYRVYCPECGQVIDAWSGRVNAPGHSRIDGSTGLSEYCDGSGRRLKGMETAP